jgi:threo-3-hydroxy-L-aspartate ammonia-lyase
VSLVDEAVGRLGDSLVRTPVLTVGPTPEIARLLVLKAELFQRTGSFKARGALNRILAMSPEERSAGVITFSAGNHAQAVAWACNQLDIDCLVVMWADANPQKMAATRQWGAAIDTEAANSSGAADRLRELLQSTGRALVHPFDDELVIAGAGTATRELLEDAAPLDVLIVPTSGGGLLAGAALALDGAGAQTRLLAVQTAASPSLAAAFDAGGPVRQPAEPTCADALTAPFYGDANFAIVKERVESVTLVSEDEIAEGVRWFYARAKLAVEPGAAVTAAALIAGKVEIDGAERIGVLVSGGNANPAVIAEFIRSG